jgi:hypothetical protein
MNRAGWTLSALALVCFSWRVFVPPILGLANNGDFAKIAGPLRLGPASGGPDDRFRYVTRDYRRAPENAWNSHYYSSEAVFALAAYELSRAFEPRDRFDIRWMGLLHLAAILAAFVWLMAALRPLGTTAQIAAGSMAIFIFSDAAYLAYCNTFYTDAAALTGVLLTIAALVDLAVRGYSAARLAGFVVAALLLESSKTQHALLALPLAILAWVVVRNRQALAAAAAVLAAGVIFVLVSPVNYRADPTFNLVFYKLTPQSPSPLDDLAALGLDRADARFVGMHAYMPGALTSNYDTALDLVRRVSAGRIARFYLSHPRRTAGILRRDLHDNGGKLQVAGFGNYTQDSGRPPQSLAPGYWSENRARLLERAPWIIPLWLAAISAVCLLLRSKLAWVCLGLAAMAAIEFTVASLADALDTVRHLLLFQTLLDITLIWAVTAASLRAESWYRSWRRGI